MGYLKITEKQIIDQKEERITKHSLTYQPAERKGKGHNKEQNWGLSAQEYANN